jgi:hypothetical protein
MLATFGLERLEAAIGVQNTDTEVAELIERAVPAARVEVARVNAISFAIYDEPGLPTRICRQSDEFADVNPQFQPTRQANRV